MEKRKIKKLDGLWWGLIPGMLLPLLALYLFWVFGSEYELKYFLKRSLELGVLSKELSLANIANLGLFFIYIWTNRYRSARGVIMATFFWVLIMLVIKIL